MIGRSRLLAVLFLTASCASPRGRTPVPCEPAPQHELEGRAATQLAGRWRLQLVATEGTASGRSVSGPLVLLPPPGGRLSVSGAPQAAIILVGSTEIAVEEVGAVRMGSTRSADTLAPGVAVIAGERTITIRIGADGNRRDVIRFDGGYFALQVRSLTADRFAGSWVSGGAGPEESGGYFCATRM